MPWRPAALCLQRRFLLLPVGCPQPQIPSFVPIQHSLPCTTSPLVPAGISPGAANSSMGTRFKMRSRLHFSGSPHCRIMSTISQSQVVPGKKPGVQPALFSPEPHHGHWRNIPISQAGTLTRFGEGDHHDVLGTALEGVNPLPAQSKGADHGNAMHCAPGLPQVGAQIRHPAFDWDLLQGGWQASRDHLIPRGFPKSLLSPPLLAKVKETIPCLLMS